MTKSIHHSCLPTGTERDRGANRNWWHPRSNFTPFRPRQRLKQTEIYSPARDCSHPWLPLFFTSSLLSSPQSPLFCIFIPELIKSERMQHIISSYFTFGVEGGGGGGGWEVISSTFDESRDICFALWWSDMRSPVTSPVEVKTFEQQVTAGKWLINNDMKEKECTQVATIISFKMYCILHKKSLMIASRIQSDMILGWLSSQVNILIEIDTVCS